MEKSSRVETEKDDPKEDLLEIFMTGGPPWGFTISGGSEFGTQVYVKRVAEDGIARKVGGLKEGDRLIFINGVTCTSRTEAIEAVRGGERELKIKLKRLESATQDSVPKACPPKRSNSFYDSVVEDMLDSVSSDISYTHYSRRRDTIRGDKSSPRHFHGSKFTGIENTSLKESKAKEDIPRTEAYSPVKTLISLSPSEESQKSRGSPLQSSNRNFQRVKVKSVKVTSMVPGVKNDIHEQLKSKIETDVRHDVNRSRGDQSLNEKNRSRQTKSMDEGGPAWNDSLGKKQATTPPAMFANRTLQPRIDGVNSTEMNVSQAKAMFESISKSQEMLDNMVARNSAQRSSPPLEKRKEANFIKPREPVSRAVVSSCDTSAVASEVANELPSHSRTKSLPVENFEGPRREIRRPGTAPHRRSLGRARPKSAHLPSEEGNSGAQYLPLGYAAVPANDRICHGRKSIASCHPNTENLYKKEASFRHSSEDLRQNENFAIRPDRKSSTLPANQMREAAKKFHQELMRKDPKFRYSFGQIDPLSRPVHHGSSAGGSSSSSLNSSQDQINNADQARRLSNGPTVFSRACSTTSLDSSPGVQEAPAMPTDDDNTILSRLLREQRITNNSNLVSIEEEARSPRGKSRAFSETECSHDAVEADERKGRRTISIQTDFIPEVSKKRESFIKRRFSDQTSQPPGSSVQDVIPVETCIDDVDPSIIESAGAPVKPVSPTFDQSTSHAKEPSSDSIEELDEINRVGEQNAENVSEEGEEFPVTDIDALPPPPEEFLIASPPEREKPQRVINRKKRDHNFNYGASRNSSCVSTDSNVSTSTMDSGIGVRPYSMSDTSPRNSPTRGPSEFDDDYNQGCDEGFKGSREELLEEDCQTYSPGPADDSDQREYKDDEMSEESPSKYDSPDSESRHSSTSLSPKIEELDNKKASLIESIQKKIDELKLQEQEIGEEIKLNEDLGKKVRGLVERKANQTEFSKYELFIGELNKIVALLLSLTQRLHRYEQMLQDLDMSEEEDKLKREALVSKIDKLRSQHEEACHLREVNDRRGENVANFLDKYFNEEEFADFQYYVDMKSQLALMQSEIKEKVKLGEERYQALYSTGTF